MEDTLELEARVAQEAARTCRGRARDQLMLGTYRDHLEVSGNWAIPRSSTLKGISIINHPDM